MKTVWGIAACVILFSTAAQASIFTVFSDQGISGTDIFNWPQPADAPGATVTQSSTAVPAAGVPEGQYTMLTQGSPYDGWGVFYKNGVDLSSYASGELRFWIYSATSNLSLSLEHTTNGLDKCTGLTTGHAKDCFDFSTVLQPYVNQWVLVALPLTGLTLSDLYSPFEITANTAAPFYIDNVRYVSSVGAPVFTMSVKNISDQQPAAGLTWSASPSGWARANQFLQLELDSYDLQTWGVQIYTDNTAAGANPPFVLRSGSVAGDPGTNPAGLISTTDHAIQLPMAWSITAATQAPSAVAPPAADPNTNPQNPNAFPWLFIKDHATPKIASENTTAFQNGDIDPYVVLVNNKGIHFGQNNAQGAPSIGAQNPPYDVFLEANMGAALAQQTYQTSKIIVEFFQE